ncbi:MAG: LacI family DNA-binding transcriptional regulator [Alphaproteobacteria bacterium]|nr:LacI family DNA-binding transcriptional regulator [Alphaproteobacteria bacterium]
MRPTTKDLAVAAGVSLATVDRVLNGRPGVKQHTIEKVSEAIRKIGFERNISAANLAKQKTYTFLFLFPETGDEFLDELIFKIREVSQAFTADMISADVRRIDASDPHKVANCLAGLGNDEVDGVAVMAPETPPVRDAMNRLTERGIRAVSFLSGRPQNSDTDYVGIDNHAAGATSAHLMGRFIGPKKGSILVVTETMQARDSIERRLGFDAVMNRDYPDLHPLPSLETYGHQERTQLVVANAFSNNSDIVGAYVLSAEARTPVEAIIGMPGASDVVCIAHERTPFTESALKANQLDAIIAQNPGHLVRSAIRILRARCDSREPLASQEKIRIEILLKDNL